MRWRKRRIQSLARESIENLFELADEAYSSHPDRAHRYMEIVRNISMRTRVRIPRHLKRRFCRRCHHFLVHGDNCRVRTRNGKVVVTCLDCGNVMRIPFVHEKKHRAKNLTDTR
ncbi:MAG: ribonuclease P [Theionarchaea archaeon]|nr:ribonuclease P [Theionarchaea archaeon]MBU6999193.1 ribonuclease P [Theionarchaea archaeon]MBU7019682.1 ribonuclease P [Theionarchaea archaeon]MBU7035841.1 ribonuclease P [Theionarchaea archaeon]MBU7041562.1 ribonuclease P [Theionarchaea archaeon]